MILQQLKEIISVLTLGELGRLLEIYKLSGLDEDHVHPTFSPPQNKQLMVNSFHNILGMWLSSLSNKHGIKDSYYIFDSACGCLK